MTETARATPDGTPHRVQKRRTSKRTLRYLAAAVGVVSFLLPWVVIRAVPKPASAAGQVVVAPAGSQIVVTGSGSNSGVVVVPGQAGGATTPAVTTTGASAPPPPGV